MVEFERVFLFAAHIEREGVHRAAFQVSEAAAGRGEIPSFEGDVGAAVGKAGLIDGDAVQGVGMVDAHGVRFAFAGGFVGDFQLAGKIAGHARVVEVDIEFFQFHGKGQLLHQHAFVGVEKHHVGLLPFAEVYIAAK